MIRAFTAKQDQLAQLTPQQPLSGAMWIDLDTPTAQETRVVGTALGAEIPSRADMAEIEISSRLYHDKGVNYMTVLMPVNAQKDTAEVVPISFVLTQTQLATVRYHTPTLFKSYPDRAGKTLAGCGSADAVFLGLIEECIDRIADVFEWAGRDFDALSARLFSPKPGERPKSDEMQGVLADIGSKGDLVGDLRASLLTIERALGFLDPVLKSHGDGPDLRTCLEVAIRDVHSLSEHAGFLSQKTGLLLDATLGMINIEQNAIIKIFSVAAVVFLPPTLVASIYGMNFRHMPELAWGYGYPAALVLMVITAVLPLVYFRKRGWL